MQIEYSNFGPIKEGLLELSKLTVICGKNNCGKTYVAHSIDYIFNRFLLELRDLINQHIFPILKKRNSEAAEDLNFVVSFDDLYDEILHKKNLDQLNRQNPENLTSYFSAPDHYFAESEITVSIPFEEIRDSLYAYKGVMRFGGGMRIETQPQSHAIHVSFADDDNARKAPIARYLSAAATRISKLILKAVLVRSFTIPGERSGLALLCKNYIADALDGYFSTPMPVSENAMDTPKNNLTRPTHNFIKFLLDPSEVDYYFFATKNGSNPTRIISPMLRGEIHIDGTTIRYKPDDMDDDLDLHMTSSSVKSLLGLELILDPLGGFQTVIIDEPELNLHPELQREFAGRIAMLVNKGYTIIVTTHSEFMMGEFNILLNLSSLSEDLREKYYKKYGYTDEMLLKKDTFAAYTAVDGRLTKMPFDEQEGYIVNTFNEVIHSQNEIINELVNDLDGDER
jgi:hypothetical protein